MQTLFDILNSGFVTSIIGAALAAFAGAYGGQRIVERGKLRTDLLQEVRNTNAATMLGFTIFNAAISVKKQHVRSLKEHFDRDRSDAIAFLERVAQGRRRPGEIFQYQADLRILPKMDSPIEILVRQVYDKISVTGRPLSVVSVLATTIADLNECIDKRNQWVASFRAASSSMSWEQACQRYFGFVEATGHLDQTYSDLIFAIATKTDDAIFFSKLLCSDLVAHAKETGAEFKKRFGKRHIVKISTPDFTTLVDQTLLPNEAEYADWSKAFVPAKS